MMKCGLLRPNYIGERFYTAATCQAPYYQPHPSSSICDKCVLRSLFNDWHQKPNRRQRKERKKKVKELDNWYTNHNIKMKSLEAMRPLVEKIQRQGIRFDCPDLNGFYQKETMELNCDLFKKNNRIVCPEIKDCDCIYEDTYFQTVKKLSDEALEAFKQGQYEFKSSVEMQIKKQLEELAAKATKEPPKVDH